MGVRSRSKSKRRRRRATLSVGNGDGGVGRDLISSLTHDLLVRILDLLPDTRDVVRTHALSRRWRGLWTGVPALRFNSVRSPAVRREAGAAEQYLAFVDDALMLRANAKRSCAAKEPAVKDLVISLNIMRQKTEELVPRCFQAAQGWIRYAVQHEVKSFILQLDLPWVYEDRIQDEGRSDDDVEKNMGRHPVMAIDELATSGKLETMHLKLGFAQLGLFSSSSSVVFASLTDLLLEDITITGHLVSRIVSSPCCPRLRKLRLSYLHLSTMEELLLEADELLELSLHMIKKIQSLELKTPSLSVLHVEHCSDLEGFTVLAPRLEDLSMFSANEPLRIDDIHGHLSRVGTLKIPFYSNGINNCSIHLLQCCRSTTCLEVSLKVTKAMYHQTSDIIKGRIPSLPHVTSLTINVSLWETHSFGASIASFLAQCNNIRCLSLILGCVVIEKGYYLCDNSCQRKSYEFSLAQLQEVKFNQLIGTECDLQFIQAILKRATGVQKVAVSFNPYYWKKENKHAFELMPPMDGGSWTSCNNADLSYKWRRDCV